MPDQIVNTDFIPAANELQATKAFGKQSVLFDGMYSPNTIIRYKRDRVREHIEKYLKAGSAILELNAGTGEDAIYFAEKSHHVHATDISKDMLRVLIQKSKDNGLSNNISAEVCSYTTLKSLSDKGPYDLIFSNFAGLNCTSELDKVLNSLTPLVKPGGMITLVILPGFCLWETLLLFKGKFKTAFRRSLSSKGAKAHIEGEYFKCWYYSPSYVVKTLKNNFQVLDLEGLCTVVPPSYIENFAEKYPRVYSFLKKAEDWLKNKWPWNLIGDYYIISFRKK